MDISSIPEKDRNDFRKRMARLGLDETAAIAEEIEASNGATVSLSMAQESAVKPLILQTSNLDTLREWIGSPDKALEKQVVAPFARMPEIGQMAGGLPNITPGLRRASISREAVANLTGRKLSDVTGVNPVKLLDQVKRLREAPVSSAMRLAAAEIDTIRAAARTYLRGDQKLVAEYKPAVEAYFGVFQIAVWLCLTIRVKKNSTLSLGPGVNNLTAYQIIIEEGGRVSSRGHLNVNATIIRRSSGGGIRLPEHVLTGPLRSPVFP